MTEQMKAEGFVSDSHSRVTHRAAILPILTLLLLGKDIPVVDS